LVCGLGLRSTGPRFRGRSGSFLLLKEFSMAFCFCLGAFLVSLGPDALEVFRLLLLQLGGLLRLSEDIVTEGLDALLEFLP
jgi:hypothetical protein